MSDIESWKHIPGFNHYEISDQGRVRSLPRTRARGGILQGDLDRHGYPRVTLTENNRSVTRSLHVLVAAAFLGPRPPLLETRHLDGDRLNCHVSNLAYGTSRENKLDVVRHGTHKNANKTTCGNGHPYDEENTYRFGTRRQCRTCNRDAVARYKARTQVGAAS